MKAKTATHGPRRVLVVDATVFYRELVVELLGQHGYQATGAGSAAEAVALLDTQPKPDVVLVDAGLGDSLRFFEHLNRAAPSAKSLILTRGHFDETEVRRLASLGTAGRVNTAAPIEELLIAVAGVLFPEERDARRSPRALLSIPLSYRAGGLVQSSHTFNLSSDGMFVVTTADPPLPPGSRLELTFWLPGSPALIDCQGVVIWRNSPGERVNELYPPGMGVMFHALDANTAAIVNGYVRAHLGQSFD